MSSLLGAIFTTDGLGQYQYLESIVKFLDMIVVPATITLGLTAAVMVVIYAVLIAKAEDAEKIKESKKRLVGLMIAIIIITVLIWIFGYVLSNFGTIMDFFRNTLGFFKF